VHVDNLRNLNVETCLVASHDEAWLWHNWLGHISMSQLHKLSKLELVRGLPKIDFKKDKLCDACQFGKQFKSSFKSLNVVSTSKPLEFLHLDRFGPSRTVSLGGKRYAFVIVDDFSRFTWILFLANKYDAFERFKSFCKHV